MPKVTYIEFNGTEHPVEVETGLSLMRGAVENGVPGIIADCGGTCSCGTCRVLVDPDWREATGEPSDMEEAMLEISEDNGPGYRLSCQINITEAFDGLVVRLPWRQF